ncbi:MAG: glycosyltransferase [Pseudomonadota bacterium]
MIILHTANFDRKKSYRAMYNCDYKINNGMIRSGHAVYSFSDRDVARESNPLNISKLGKKTANKKWLQIFKTIEPDLVLLGHADIITNETLETAKSLKNNLKIAYYNVDALFVPSNIAAIKKRVGVVDTIYITTGGNEIKQFEAENTKSFFIPNPLDNSIEMGKAFENSNQEYDVIFCTVRSNESDARVKFMLELQEKLPDVKFGLYGMLGKDSVFGAEYLRVLPNAKMAVNLSRTGDRGYSEQHNYLYSSDRLSHIIGNGLLAFIDKNTGLSALYSDKEAVFYQDIKDLSDKILYYKNHDKERKEIAQNGWQKAQSEFNERNVASYIVETTFSIPFSKKYIWAGM